MSIKKLAGNVRKGTHLTGSADASEFLTQKVRALLGKSYPSFFNTPLGKIIEPIIVPALVAELARYLKGRVNGAGTLEKIADHAVVSLSGNVVKSIIATYVPGLLSLFDVGTLADLALNDDDEYDDEDE